MSDRHGSARAGLENQVVAALRTIARALDLYSHELTERSGLTGPQLATLHTADRLGPVSLGELARAVQVSQATMSGILDRLEKRGMVARARDARDRRNVMISLTDRGRAVLAAAPPLLQERFGRELAKLPEWEQNQMLATLQRVATMMGPQGFGVDEGAEGGAWPSPSSRAGMDPDRQAAEDVGA